jgi:hypothetical protein
MAVRCWEVRRMRRYLSKDMKAQLDKKSKFLEIFCIAWWTLIKGIPYFKTKELRKSISIVLTTLLSILGDGCVNLLDLIIKYLYQFLLHIYVYLSICIYV